MIAPTRILVFQTAFLGDVILTLPMIQILKKKFPDSEIDVVTTPKAAELLVHPAVSRIIPYDKRRSQKGITGMAALSGILRKNKYDIALLPHRSFRTAIITALSGIPKRVGFSTGSGRQLYTDIVPYVKFEHEVDRNNALLGPLGIDVLHKELPSLYPSVSDAERVTKILFDREIVQHDRMISIAPGSVWNTKRWLMERFAELSSALAKIGFAVMIVGGKEDAELGRAIVESTRHKNIHDMTGIFSLLESAELIRRSAVLVTNDSAPLHIGVAVRTPVIAIFGATVPEFGFAPYGDHDTVIETYGLPCRPCAIHGGNSCPIGTFDCMKKIGVDMVFQAAMEKTGLKKI